MKQLHREVSGDDLQQIEVKVENDHIQRITTARPLLAISELIWNAYYADATEVRVQLEAGPLTKLDIIRVIDNGTGIPRESVEESFQKLGGSWKKLAGKTTGGRALHGEKGQGRFKAFALGEAVTWTSSDGIESYKIIGRKTDLKRFDLSQPVASSKRGCSVEITDVAKDFEIWAEDGFADRVRDLFALQLYDDPKFHIIYDGVEVDARAAIAAVTPYPIRVTASGGETLEATLEVVEWKRPVDRKLMLCLPGRFSFHDMAPGKNLIGVKITLRDILSDPDCVKRKVTDYLRGLSYHNFSLVAEIYKAALGLDIFPNPNIEKTLMISLPVRHDCVHRNGQTKEGEPRTGISRPYVVEIGVAMFGMATTIENLMDARKVALARREAGLPAELVI